MPTIYIFYILSNKFKNENDNQLILFDISKADGAINREILSDVHYERGISISLIKVIRTGHKGTKLRGKLWYCRWGVGVINKGVFQGSPLSSFLYIGCRYDERRL